MADVNFDIDFGARLGARMGDFGRFAGDAESVLEEAEDRFQEKLIELWPVDTGTSLQMWRNDVDGLLWELGCDAEYAEWVFEAGTYAGPENTVRIADVLETHAQKIATRVESALRELLTRARADLGPQRPLFGASVVTGQTATQRGQARLRGSIVQAFERRGARQRLRERFPNQPIGRAASRQRDRSRLR